MYSELWIKCYFQLQEIVFFFKFLFIFTFYTLIKIMMKMTDQHIMSVNLVLEFDTGPLKVRKTLYADDGRLFL